MDRLTNHKTFVLGYNIFMYGYFRNKKCHDNCNRVMEEN